MQFLLETVQVLLLSIWFSLESLFFMVVPRRRKNISGQVVLITGAGSGIGRLMAQEFGALDTVVVLWDINQEGMKETARLAGQCGARRVFHYLCDCSDKTEVYTVADKVRVHRLGTDASLSHGDCRQSAGLFFFFFFCWALLLFPSVSSGFYTGGQRCPSRTKSPSNVDIYCKDLPPDRTEKLSRTHT